MMDGIRNIKVIFLSQIFIFYATIEIWIMNSFGSPENFVFLCSYLIAGLCVKSLNKPKNYFNNNKFVSISALLCTISATSKLIGLPLLFIPIFMINRFDKRINFLVKFCFFSFLVCLPFFIVMANWSQLYSDLISLFKTVIFENSSFDVKKIIIFYITKFENIFNTFAGLSYFLIFYFILLCINIKLNILINMKT